MPARRSFLNVSILRLNVILVQRIKYFLKEYNCHEGGDLRLAPACQISHNILVKQCGFRVQKRQTFGIFCTTLPIMGESIEQLMTNIPEVSYGIPNFTAISTKMGAQGPKHPNMEVFVQVCPKEQTLGVQKRIIPAAQILCEYRRDRLYRDAIKVF